MLTTLLVFFILSTIVYIVMALKQIKNITEIHGSSIFTNNKMLQLGLFDIGRNVGIIILLIYILGVI